MDSGIKKDPHPELSTSPPIKISVRTPSPPNIQNSIVSLKVGDIDQVSSSQCANSIARRGSSEVKIKPPPKLPSSTGEAISYMQTLIAYMSAKDEENDSLKNGLTLLQSKYGQKKNVLKAKDDISARLQDQVDILQKEKTKTEAETKLTMRKFYDESNSLRAEMLYLKEENSKQENSISTLMSTKQHLEESLETQKLVCVKLTESHEKYEEKVLNLSRQNSYLGEKVKYFSGKLATSQRRVEQLESIFKTEEMEKRRLFCKQGAFEECFKTTMNNWHDRFYTIFPHEPVPIPGHPNGNLIHPVMNEERVGMNKPNSGFPREINANIMVPPPESRNPGEDCGKRSFPSGALPESGMSEGTSTQVMHYDPRLHNKRQRTAK